MPGAAIEVIVEGDSRRLVRSLKEAEDELKDLQKELKKTTDGGEFDRLAKQINKVNAEIKGIKTASASGGLDKLGKSSVDATGDLINLGRVVQDAPFGFIGIANNLNPLIEGFKRTSAGAGGLKGGLKALGSSLAGAGGLSLLVSAASTALILFGDELFGVGKAAKAANEAIDGLAKGVADDLAKLTTLTGLIKNVNTATGERKKALEAFNKEYKTYLEDLGIEEVKLGNIEKAYDGIINAMLRQAVVKGLQDEISAAIQKTAAEIIKLQIEQEKYRLGLKGTAAELKKLPKVQVNLSKDLQAYNRVAQDGIIAQAGIANAAEAAADETAGLGGRINKLTEDLKKTLAPLLNLTTNFEDLGIKLEDTGKKGDKVLDDLLKRAKALEAFVNNNTVRLANFVIDPDASRAEKIKGAKEFIERALNRSIGAGRGLELKPGSLLIKETGVILENIKLLRGEKYFSNLRGIAEDFRKDLEKQIQDLTKRNPILIAQQVNLKQLEANREALRRALEAGNFEGITKVIADIQSSAYPVLKGLNDRLVNTANTLNTILTPAFTSLFTAITQGENPLKAFFKSIQQAIGQLIQRLIQAVIQALILRAIFGGKAGSFGDLFKSFAGFRAEGGPVTAGKSYVVGENGPEIFTASRSGSIIPNGGVGRVAASAGSMAMAPQLFLRGRDAYLQWSRQSGYNNRNI